jgi:hypothetical protein
MRLAEREGQVLEASLRREPLPVRDTLRTLKGPQRGERVRSAVASAVRSA